MKRVAPTGPSLPRARTRLVRVGRVDIGGDAPVSVQSMTITDTRDVDATLAQIYQLASEGCEIARLAVPDVEAAEALAAIKPRSPLPIVAQSAARVISEERRKYQSVSAGKSPSSLTVGSSSAATLTTTT